MRRSRAVPFILLQAVFLSQIVGLRLASPDYPTGTMQDPGEHPGVQILVISDNNPDEKERFISDFNEETGDWEWILQKPPPEEGGDAAADNSKVYDDGFDVDILQSRTELFSNGNLASGADLYPRNPKTQRFYLPPGYMANATLLYHWSGSSWSLCGNSGWMYNPGTQFVHAPTIRWGVNPCGGGYYGTVSYGYHWNGGWKGGALWSGYLFSVDFTLFAATHGGAHRQSPPDRAPRVRMIRPATPSKGMVTLRNQAS